MEERFIATADLGTSKIAVSVSRVTGDDIQVLYYKENPSEGIRYSTVFNPTKAAAPLKKALEEAEKELKLKITQLVIGYPRYSVRQECRPACLNRTDPQSCITEEEVLMLKDMALDSYPLSDDSREEIFGAVAQSFSADDLFQGLENDIIGIPSDTLSGNFKIFIGSKRAVSNIDILMESIGIKTVWRYFLPDVTAKAVLTSQEMDNGVALVEIGAGVTSVTIYQRSILRHYCSIPFGAKNVTMDIKYECAFTERLSENIKLTYGACMPEKLVTMGEKIIQINDDESGSSQQLPVKYLSEIITARSREIINAILFEIQRSGYADKLRSGIVITGGGANLANLGNLIKDMSGYNVKMGFPRCKQLSFDGIDDICEAGAAATVGLIMSVKSDKSINCTATVKEGTGYTAIQDGTLFGDVKTAKKSLFRRRKTENVQQEGEEKSRLSWGSKISDGIGNIFDGTVGTLFDDMK